MSITVQEVKDALKKYDASYEKLQKVKTQKAELEKKTDELRREALDLMDRADLDKVQIGGKQYIPGTTYYHKVVDEGAFLEWAATQDEALTTQKPHAKLLNALIRDCINDEREFPPGLEARVVEKITRK